MKGFDLTAQTSAAKLEDVGTVVHIHGIDEVPLYYDDPSVVNDPPQLPVTITVAGAHSPKFRRVEEALRKRKLKPRQFTGEVVYEDNVEKVVACTIGWAGFAANGVEIEFTPHNVRQIYVQCPWVYEQVLEAMHDHARFFGNGSTPPASTSSSTLS